MQFDLLSGDRGEYKTSSMMDKKSAFFGLFLEINETIPLQSSVNSSVLDSKKKYKLLFGNGTSLLYPRAV